MKKYLFLFLALNLISFSRELTLDDSLNLAKKNNRSLKEKEINVQQKKLNEKINIKNILPSLSVQSKHFDYENTKNLDSLFQSGAYLSQSLFSGGEKFYNIKSSKASREFEESEYNSEGLRLSLNVIVSYVKILQLEKSLEVYKASRKEKLSELEKQKQFYELSLIDKSEILRIETSLYQSEANVLKIQNNINTEKFTLKNLLGIDINETVSLKEMEEKEFLTKDIDLKKDIVFAMKNSTLAKKLNKKIEISEYNSKSVKGNFLPKVDLEYGYESLEENSFKRSNDNWQWKLGITFKWDIFNFGSEIDSYKSSTFEIEKQKNYKIDSLETLKREISTAYLDLTTSSAVIKTNEKALLTSLETYNIDKEKFSNRIIDSVNFLKTEAELRDAQITYLNSQLDYFIYYHQYLILLK
ncbi:MAG: TolC family protein [Fusobacteriaceae bacterium]